MKVIRDDYCIIKVEDVFREPVPSYIELPFNLERKSYIKYVDEETIKYFSERSDIVDYDDIAGLSEEEIDELIDAVYKVYNREPDLEEELVDSIYRIYGGKNDAEDIYRELGRLKNLYEELIEYKYSTREKLAHLVEHGDVYGSIIRKRGAKK